MYVMLSLIFFVILIGSLQLPNYLENNIWSLYTRDTLMLPAKLSTEIPPPEHHLRFTLWLARNALAYNDPDHAQELVTPLAEKGNGDALSILGDALSAQGEFVAAVQAWSQAGDLNSLLIATHLAQDDGRINDTLTALRAAYLIDAERVTLPLATILWDSSGGQVEAETLLRQAIEQFPHSNQRLGWMQKLGYFLRKNNRWNEAEIILQELLLENPLDWQSNIELGWVFYERGDGLEKAQSAFYTAIRIDPSRGNGYYAMGQVLAKEKLYKEADVWFVQALERKPDEPWWWVNRGNTARSASDFELALQVYRQTISLFPDFAPGYYDIALAYRLIGDQQGALEAIDKAIVLMNPPNIEYYVRAGQVYEWAGEEAKAFAAYNGALHLDPKNDAAQQGLHSIENK